MKTPELVFVAMIVFASCNTTTTEQVQKIKDLAKEDSAKAAQTSQKDSLITSYLNDLDEIQQNLDQIKEREKIITMNPSELNSDDRQSVVAEVKELDDWIVDNDKKMNSLQEILRKMDSKNAKLQDLVAHLTQETAEKDEEIADLQTKLGKENDSVKLIAARFNDSIFVIKKQRAQMAVMRTVYYITGTIKQLRDKGVIDKNGGFIGLGRVAELNPAVNNAVFTKAPLNDLKGINLHGKFRRLITLHPAEAYKIISNGKTKADSIVISMPTIFWNESKYLVVAIK